MSNTVQQPTQNISDSDSIKLARIVLNHVVQQSMRGDKASGKLLAKAAKEAGLQ